MGSNQGGLVYNILIVPVILCDELSDMTTCLPKWNCAHKLLGTICSEKVGGGGLVRNSDSTCDPLR